MKTSLLRVFLAFCLLPVIVAFTNPGQQGRDLQRKAQSSTQLAFFGKAKDDGSPGDYVCKVSLEEHFD